MLDPVTLSIASQALDAASLRQRVIAENIANAETPGYTPQRVVFEEYLDDARSELRRGRRVQFAEMTTPYIVDESTNASSLLGGASVRIDSEVAQLARNSVQYQALTKALSGQYSLLDIALGGSGGKS